MKKQPAQYNSPEDVIMQTQKQLEIRKREFAELELIQYELMQYISACRRRINQSQYHLEDSERYQVTGQDYKDLLEQLLADKRRELAVAKKYCDDIDSRCELAVQEARRTSISKIIAEITQFEQMIAQLRVSFANSQASLTCDFQDENQIYYQITELMAERDRLNAEMYQLGRKAQNDEHQRYIEALSAEIKQFQAQIATAQCSMYNSYPTADIAKESQHKLLEMSIRAVEAELFAYSSEESSANYTETACDERLQQQVDYVEEVAARTLKILLENVIQPDSL